jgi:PncC family amidohydrolase
MYFMNPEALETVKKVHELFRSKGLTLSIAESCTGGLICHYITTFPGASDFFTSGIVAYSAEVKENILGIAHETLNKHGVVSAEIALEMAKKVRLLSKTDFAVATTGNLGPDVLEGKERGLVYIAAVGDKGTVLRELKLRGNRAENKEEAALSALRLLTELLDLS